MKRIALIGWATPTGLGTMNHEFARQDFVHKWLVPRHPSLGVVLGDVDRAKVRECAVDCGADDLNWLCDGTDIVLFVERPYVRPSTQYAWLKSVRDRGLKTVLVPMVEAIDSSMRWLGDVDMVVCPNDHAVRRMAAVGRECMASGKSMPWVEPCRLACVPWGVDVGMFKARVRAKAETFLFCNGFGGVLERKGLRSVIDVAQLVPDARFVIRSQVAIPLRACPPNVDVHIGSVQSSAELYERGDVYLAPSKFEGLGLQSFEAMASGLPVVTTDAPPMNECFTLSTIRCWMGLGRYGGREIETANVDVDHFAEVIRSLNGADIFGASSRAIATALSRSTSIRMDWFLKALEPLECGTLAGVG